MSNTWNAQELRIASEAMRALGFMGYEEFCDELEKQNSFELDYRTGNGLMEAYIDAKKSGDQAAADQAFDRYERFTDSIMAKGETYWDIYFRYNDSLSCGNKYLDFACMDGDTDVTEIVSCLKENGIRHFTLSADGSNMLEIVWRFQQNGCRPMNMVDVNLPILNADGTDYKKAHGCLFVID